MDKVDIHMLRDALTEVLDDFGVKHGFSVRVVGPIMYSPLGNATVKVEVAEIQDGKVQSKEITDWLARCYEFALEKDWLGQTFDLEGETYRIAGLKPRRSKYPVYAVRVRDGRAFKFPVRVIRGCFFKSLGVVPPDEPD